MNTNPQADLDAEQARWRAALAARHFSDDGRTLQGRVEWPGPTGPAHALIEIEPTTAFPFAPPEVRVLEPGADIEFTFHLNLPVAPRRHENLCLWQDVYPVDTAPWLDVDMLLDRVRDWLTQTAAGWPDDDVCDLERYLPADTRMVLYDSGTLHNLPGACVRVADNTKPVITVTTERRLRRRRVPARGDRKLCWIGDLGEVRRPIRDWADLRAALGQHGGEVERLVRLGIVRFLLLEYRRGGNTAVLAVVAQPEPGSTRLTIAAAEAADTSRATRMLRAGAPSAMLAERMVAVVGVGAIGSYVTDLLFRTGLFRLNLLDPERLRPGNVIRHLVDDRYIGWSKVHAVRSYLALRGLDTAHVQTAVLRVSTPAEAITLHQTHDLVVDATASDQTTSLLTWAATATGTPLVSVCLQRYGALARIDRYPLRAGETHLPPLPEQPDTLMVREPGCGQLVSPTPPSAVVCAAELAVRMVLDELGDTPTLPATVVETRVPENNPCQRAGPPASSAAA